MEASIMAENEKKAALFVSKVMRLTILFFAGVYMLNVLGIFQVNKTVMSVSLGISTVLMIIPTILVDVLKINASWIKYLIATLATSMVGILSIGLSYHVVVLYVYGILIASTFYSKKLNIYTMLITTVILTVCQFIGFHIGALTDHNATTLKKLIVFLIIPRQIELILMSLIVIIFNRRTHQLLTMCIETSEKQQVLYGQLKEVMSKGLGISNGLVESVKVLNNISEESTVVSKSVAESTKQIKAGVDKTVDYLNTTTQSIETMTENLEEISSQSEEVGSLSKKVNDMSIDNNRIMDRAYTAMQDIQEKTENNKNKIHHLGIRSNQIKSIVEAICGIADQTSLLALNASIEAARAGEGGKGFAVVASEVGKLADQSQKLAQDVEHIIEEIAQETEESIVLMDANATSVQAGMKIIDEAKQCILNTQDVSLGMNNIIQELADAISATVIESEQILLMAKQMGEVNDSSKEETTSIADKVDVQFDLADNINKSIRQIKKMAEEMLEVSNLEKTAV